MIKRQQGTVFFDMLDAEQKENFINEFSSQYADVSVNKYLSSEYSDFHDFIGGAFVFSNTSQGFKYWNDIRHIEKGALGEDNSYSVIEILDRAIKLMAEHEQDDTVYLICGKEFYDLMNREERTEFHSEFTSQRHSYNFDEYMNETHFNSFNQFISGSIDWNNSKRGLEYWANISTKYSFNEVYETLEELNIATDGTT